jgi:hypothetical protein
MLTPTIPRLTTDEERRHIKVRTAQLIAAAGGGEFLAPVTGVDKAALSKYGGLAYPDSFIRADVMIELDRQLQAPMMVEFMANLLGYTLVPLEPDQSAAVGVDDLADVHKETSEAVTSIATLVSGRADIAAAKRAVFKETDEAIRALYRAQRKVAA